MPSAKKKVVPRVPRTRGGSRYTESAFWGFIRSGLRAKYQRWGPRYDVLAAARRPYTGPNKKQKWEFQCFKCRKWHIQRSVEVDHIVPCGSLRSFADLPQFVERLFCEQSGLRVACKTCHLKITKDSK